MNRPARLHHPLVAALAACLGAGPALAQEADARPQAAGEIEPAEERKARAPTEAEQAAAARLKTQADEAYLAGQYALALQRLQAAHRLDPDPRYVANQGLVLEQLSRYAEAVEAFEQFLATDPPADKAAAAKAVIERLRPEVRIETAPPGATVRLQGDERPRGTTPLVMRLVAGTHTLIIEREGHARWRQTAKVLPGEGLRVQAALAPLPAPPPAPPPEVRTEFGTSGWGYVALGTAVAAGASGAVLYGLGVEAVDDRDNADTGEAWDAANRQVSTYDTSTTVAAAVAGAALVAGVILLSWGGDDGAADEATISLSAGPAGGVLWGRF